MPTSLRNWFIIHFLIDYIVAIVLFLYPYQLAVFLGWGRVDPLAFRLVAAALFAIGGVSLVAKNADIVVFKYLLILKIIWSLSAIGGILFTALSGPIPVAAWVILTIFLAFSFVWIYYYLRVEN